MGTLGPRLLQHIVLPAGQPADLGITSEGLGGYSCFVIKNEEIEAQSSPWFWVQPAHLNQGASELWCLGFGTETGEHFLILALKKHLLSIYCVPGTGESGDNKWCFTELVPRDLTFWQGTQNTPQ